jgi:hypothetical protein
MENEFVPYEKALALKELGFNELCLKEFHKGVLLTNSCGEELNNSELIYLYGKKDTVIAAPLWQQAFRWFREKHSIFAYVGRCAGIRAESYFVDIYTVSTSLGIYDDAQEQVIFNTHEEAEIECLKKLIEIVKEKQDGK